MHEYIDENSKILTNECPGYGLQKISRLKSQCENMNFSEQIRYNRLFKQVVNKGGESAINYIKRFNNAKALEISVGNGYYEYNLIHTFLDNFQKFGKYYAQIAIYQVELRRQEKFINEKLFSLSDLKIDYLNLENSVRNNERERIFLNQGAVTVEVNTQPRNDLSNREKKKAIKNHTSIHATQIISIMNVTVGNQMRASYVDWKIILSQIFRNQKLRIRKFTGTIKIQKLVRIDRRK